MPQKPGGAGLPFVINLPRSLVDPQSLYLAHHVNWMNALKGIPIHQRS